MNYVMLCPVCATPCTDKNESECAVCGSNRNPVFAYIPLVRAVELLIKRGIGVTGTDTKYCTSHKSEITIHLAGNVPEYLFNDLPDNWQLLYYDLSSYNAKAYQLYSSAIDFDNPSNTYSTMINNLEQWLENKSTDGFKAVLKLGGYDIDQ